MITAVLIVQTPIATFTVSLAPAAVLTVSTPVATLNPQE